MEFISDKIQTIKKILSSRKGLSSNVSYFDDIDIEQAMENIELYIDIDSEKQTDV